jgi:hypothetical protein
MINGFRKEAILIDPIYVPWLEKSYSPFLILLTNNRNEVLEYYFKGIYGRWKGDYIRVELGVPEGYTLLDLESMGRQNLLNSSFIQKEPEPTKVKEEENKTVEYSIFTDSGSLNKENSHWEKVLKEMINECNLFIYDSKNDKFSIISYKVHKKYCWEIVCPTRTGVYSYKNSEEMFNYWKRNLKDYLVVEQILLDKQKEKVSLFGQENFSNRSDFYRFVKNNYHVEKVNFETNKKTRKVEINATSK